MRKDLAIGKVGEDSVIKALRRAKLSAKRNSKKENRSYYDIESEIGNVPFTVEVKNDLYASKSGNIAIEIHNPRSNKKSGLSITKSDIWAHIVDSQLWVTKTKDLKKFVKTNKPVRQVDYAGDGNANLLLFKMEDILPNIFFRIDHLKGTEINTLIKRLIS